MNTEEIIKFLDRDVLVKGLKVWYFPTVLFFFFLAGGFGNSEENFGGRTYYWESKDLDGVFEIFVTLNEDGTWQKQVFRDGVEDKNWWNDVFVKPHKGTWKIDTVVKGGVKNGKEFKVLVFNDNPEMAFELNGVCVQNLSDEVMDRSQYNRSYYMTYPDNEPFLGIYGSRCPE